MIPYGSDLYKRGSSMIEYVRGAGGRVCDLPPHHLDMAAEAITYAYPRYVTRRVLELLVSGRFRPSTHPLLRGLDVAGLRRLNYLTDRDLHKSRVEKRLRSKSPRRVNT